MTQRSAREMSDAALTAELFDLGIAWDGLDREGSGSRGEWIIERMDEIETEQRRRLISLDGDIGRGNPRSPVGEQGRETK